MDTLLPLLEDRITFTPYYFYNTFMKKVSDFYRNNRKSKISFLLAIDDCSFHNKFWIDPISVPLFLSLAQQLKSFHNEPLHLSLSNTPGTADIIAFLDRADFFHLIGNNSNPIYPIGKNIFDFNPNVIGGFKLRKQRIEHKVRCYSLKEFLIADSLSNSNIEKIRDSLVEYYIYKVKDHFGVLLFENDNTISNTNDYIEILAELITNGVLHSNSETFALMYSDQFVTKMSISDNGIGLYESLKNKQDSKFYKKFELFKSLDKEFKLKIDDRIKMSLFSIFETLFYSIGKNRHGLFDLICNVVINSNGYIRLHNEYSQIIVSSRMYKELEVLYELRKEILNLHNRLLFNQISIDIFENEFNNLINRSKRYILLFANTTFNHFQTDTRFSAIRLFEVKFRGVHIEVEIPKVN